jgi:hypothetical protein
MDDEFVCCMLMELHDFFLWFIYICLEVYIMVRFVIHDKRYEFQVS